MQKEEEEEFGIINVCVCGCGWREGIKRVVKA